MDKNKGYLLPSGDAYTEDMACTLVFYPDKAEYRRALGGSLAYLATWIAWEKETDHKGIDAALCWKIALDLTMECWEMECFEELQDNVAQILAIMRQGTSCCDEQDVTHGDQYTDRVVDGVGDVPQTIIDAGYASDSSDWDGFDDYKCMIAHVIVDQLPARLNEIAPIVNTYGAVFGGVAALAGIMAVVFATGGVAMIFGLIAGVGSVSLLYESLLEGDLLTALASKVTANKDDLVCAVYQSDGDEDAIVNLNDAIDELFTTIEAVILKNMNLGPTLKALYSGRYDQQDTADILLDAGYDLGDFACDCGQIGEYISFSDFEDYTLQGWKTMGNNYVQIPGYGGSNYRYDKDNNQANWIYHSVASLCIEEGLTHPVGTKLQIHRIRFWYYMTGGSSVDVKVMCTHDAGQTDTYFGHRLVWTFAEVTFDPPLESTELTDNIVKIRTVGGGYHTSFDDISIDFDHVLP
jgi:hypothetical protein